MSVVTFAYASLLVLSCFAQSEPHTFLHVYPGIPRTPFGPDWQHYFEVKGLLPNLTRTTPPSFVGNFGVNRPDHPNATLFFWALKRLRADYAIVQNNYSWHQLADTVWVDQPVGTGYSTSDATGPQKLTLCLLVPDEDQMGKDFVGFVSNIVKIFPSRAKRPLYLMGESYAAPYITKAIFSTPHHPFTLKKIAIGDGAMGALSVFEELSTVLEHLHPDHHNRTYPQLINYDPEVFEYFKTQEHLCGYDLSLTYPQHGHFPTLVDPFLVVALPRKSSKARRALLQRTLMALGKSQPSLLNQRDVLRREEQRQEWKRSIAGRPNGTLDPYYGCFLFDELREYAANYSIPWAQVGGLAAIDVYNVPGALNPEIPVDPTIFLNDERIRAALHASTSKNWTAFFNYPFTIKILDTTGETTKSQWSDPKTRPMVFLSELAANASAHGVGIVFYSGNDDSLVAHRGTENMTFGGVQGFTRKPSTPFYDDNGNFAGIVHQERGLTYALFKKASHQVPESVPGAAFSFVRDFVLGSNSTGLVKSDGSVVGGEDPKLANDVMPRNPVIHYWASEAGGDISSVVVPSEPRAAWDTFIVTATAAHYGKQCGFVPLPLGILLTAFHRSSRNSMTTVCKQSRSNTRKLPTGLAPTRVGLRSEMTARMHGRTYQGSSALQAVCDKQTVALPKG
ncbi:Alpha/Beta hydrolase protein [Mycena capillaripes]|nr:Alpha/Beta hydrolase protein [Mycena capillaripes]